MNLIDPVVSGCYKWVINISHKICDNSTTSWLSNRIAREECYIDARILSRNRT